MIACMMLMSTAMFAQAGKFGVGANVLYGFASDYKQVGFGVKAQYEFVENFRAEVEGAYFLKKDHVSMWTANLNFHYLIPCGESFKVYPILGVGILGSAWDSEAKDAGLENTSMFAFNGGAGAEYLISENFKIDAAFRYQYGKKDGVKSDWPIVSVGCAYMF